MRSNRIGVSLLWSALALFSSVSHAADGADLVKITKSSPSGSVTLKRGSKVKFNVTVEYTLGSAEKGAVNLLLQDQNNRPLGSELSVVKKGKGSVTLEKEISIPADAKAISVFTPLMVEGAKQSMTVDAKMYPVE